MKKYKLTLRNLPALPKEGFNLNKKCLVAIGSAKNKHEKRTTSKIK